MHTGKNTNAHKEIIAIDMQVKAAYSTSGITFAQKVIYRIIIEYRTGPVNRRSYLFDIEIPASIRVGTRLVVELQ